MRSEVLDALDGQIVLAPLGGGPSTPQLAAAVSEAGGLGFLAFAYLSAEDAAARLRATRELTSQPFGVNVFMPVPGPARPESYRAFADRLGAWARQRGLPTGAPTFSDDEFDAKVELLLADPPAVVSLAFGCPERSFVDRLHAAGSEAWITVTTPEEARAAAGAGADALVVQGAEAGGHRGGFGDDDGQPVYGLLSLLQLVSVQVDTPLVATGGIATGGGIAAALCAGASAVQLGTAFMLAPEAGTSAPHRRALRGRMPTTLTRAFTGRTARGIRNAFIDAHDKHAVAAYPEIHYVTAPARSAARAAGDAGAINLWAGQAYPLARELPAGEIVRELTRDAAAALRPRERVKARDLAGVLETALYHESSAREDMERFYGELLGLVAVSRWPDGVAFRAGDGVLLIFDRERLATRTDPIADHGTRGTDHACLRARGDAYEQLRERVAAGGVQIVHDQQWPGGGRSFYFKDPGGNLLEIADRDIWPQAG